MLGLGFHPHYWRDGKKKREKEGGRRIGELKCRQKFANTNVVVIKSDDTDDNYNCWGYFQLLLCVSQAQEYVSLTPPKSCDIVTN